MKFNELEKGKIYTDKNGVETLEFVEFRNDYIATFNQCDYDDDGNLIITARIRYLTRNEVKKLI